MKNQNTNHNHLRNHLGNKQGTACAGGRKHRLATTLISAATAVTLGLGVMGCGVLPSFGGPGGQRVAATWESATGGQATNAKQAQNGQPTVAETLQQAALKTADDGTAQSATVLVYLNGSDLESEAGEATTDIAEMIESGIGTKANVVIETLGTRRWHDYGIASDHTQRYIIKDGSLELVDDRLGQLDTTDPATLSDFISWGVANYPADRYILLLWDHGAGPVYGFGVDEFQKDAYAALTLDEIQQALKENANVHFDMIGMDCCIMSTVETCLGLAPYCDYTILSEDFEPGVGWSYAGWMRTLEENPGVSMAELGKKIVDDMVSAVNVDRDGDATLALIDESAIPAVYDAWIKFAYANEGALLSSNYSQEVEWRGRPNAMGEQGQIPSGSEDGGSHGPGSSPQGQGTPQGQDSFDEVGHPYAGDYSDYDEYGDLDAYEQLFEWFGDEGWNSWGDGWDSGSPWDSGWDMWDYDMSYVTMTDYNVTDIMEVASTVESDEASNLKAAVENAIVHYRGTAGEEGMTGLSVTLPYGDPEFYSQLVDVFTAVGIDRDYIDWLGAFVEAEGADSYYDFGGGAGFGSNFGYVDELGFGFDGGYGLGPGSGYGFEGGYGQDAYGFGPDAGYGRDAYGYSQDAYGFEPGSGYGYEGGYGRDAYVYGDLGYWV